MAGHGHLAAGCSRRTRQIGQTHRGNRLRAFRADTAWTDHGTGRQERGLKHCADSETRTIPIPPELVRLLRAHIKRFGTTPDGRVFQTARGGILQDSGYNEVWAEARQKALTPAQ